MDAQNPDKPAKKIGLGDADRVDQILDRGQKFLSRQPVDRASSPRSPIVTTQSIKKEIIEKELDTALVECALNTQRRFIPHDQLFEVFSFERVRSIVSNLTCFASHLDKDKLTEEIYYGSENPHRPPCLKLFAALVGIEKIDDMAKHMDDGINDSCFPMIFKGCDNDKPISCKHHPAGHATLNEYHRPQYREDFSRWSYKLNAPFVKWGDKLHSHYILDSGDVLPIVSIHSTHSGGFSEVYKVKLHESHFDFAGHGIRHPQGFFALKKLNASDETPEQNRETFNMELSSLLFSEDKSIGVREHLIQALATFEVVNPGPQNPTWYFLFDWAEGNLSDFWKSNSHLVRDHNHLPWMARQFHGLTKALKCVHNERTETIKSFDIQKKPNSNTLYGRHGDINATNFLWFPSEPLPGIFSLADFGLGRLHRQVSRSIQNPNLTARTATYRPPEVDLKTPFISRISDIFSLGCVFLEYVTWFFGGFEGLENSAKDRTALDIHGFAADTFFTSHRDVADLERQFFIKESVRVLIQRLKTDPDCTTYLSQLLDIIGDKMLEPDHSKRMNTVLLEKEMELLSRACEDEPDFYTTKN